MPAWSVQALEESFVGIYAECCALATGAVKKVDRHPVRMKVELRGLSSSSLGAGRTDWTGHAGLGSGRWHAGWGTLDCLSTGQGMAGWQVELRGLSRQCPAPRDWTGHAGLGTGQGVGRCARMDSILWRAGGGHGAAIGLRDREREWSMIDVGLSATCVIVSS